MSDQCKAFGEKIIFNNCSAELVKKPGKVAIITGGNRGIGVHVVDKLIKCDMIVLMGVRDPEASRKSVEAKLAPTAARDKIFYEKCDTGDMSSVRRFAKKVQAKFTAIHILINNGETTHSTPNDLEIEAFIYLRIQLELCAPHTNKLKTASSHRWRLITWVISSYHIFSCLKSSQDRITAKVTRGL